MYNIVASHEKSNKTYRDAYIIVWIDIWQSVNSGYYQMVYEHVIFLFSLIVISS